LKLLSDAVCENLKRKYLNHKRTFYLFLMTKVELTSDSKPHLQVRCMSQFCLWF